MGKKDGGGRGGRKEGKEKKDAGGCPLLTKPGTEFFPAPILMQLRVGQRLCDRPGTTGAQPQTNESDVYQ